MGVCVKEGKRSGALHCAVYIINVCAATLKISDITSETHCYPLCLISKDFVQTVDQ